MPAAGRQFAFDGTHVFLTYPQSGDLSKERLRDWAVGTLGVRLFFVALEHHDDGQPHLHAYFRWDTRRRLVGTDCFDVDGRHPNIQKPRNAKHVLEYLRKDDETPLTNIGPGDITDCAGRPGWRDILDDSTDAADFLRRVGELYPRDLVLGLERIQYFLAWRFPSATEQYSGRGRREFVEPTELTQWVTDYYEVYIHCPTRYAYRLHSLTRYRYMFSDTNSNQDSM